MLQKLSEEVSECQRRAREAKERANAATDPTVTSNYLDLERRWLLLAKSYEFTQRIADYNAEARRHLAAFRPRTPPHPALPIVSCPRCGKKMRLTQIETGAEPQHRDRTTFVCDCGEALTLTANLAG